MAYKDQVKAQAYHRQYYQRNKAACNARAKAWDAANPGKRKEIDRKHAASASRKEWMAKHLAKPEVKQAAKDASARSFQANKQRAYANRRRNIKVWLEKCETEAAMNYKIHCRLGSRMATAVRRNSGDKAAKTMELVGCTVAMLRAHLQSKFKTGMTWANYGRWHIDHIIPCAEFDLRDEAQQRTCFNWKNLQPLWGAENIAKGAKLTSSNQATVIAEERT